MQHDQFQDLLDTLVKRSAVGQEVLGEMLARTSLRAPAETSRVELSAGNPTAHRTADQRIIPQGTISKAVKALMDVGLLEDGETLLRSPDGRTLSPLRFGSGYAVAGVKVVLSDEQPRQVTTALLGLDNSRVLGTAQDAADSWDQAIELIHQHVVSLKAACDQMCADAQFDDDGVVDGEDVGVRKGPAGGVPAGLWCAWWRLGGQSAVTSAAAVRALDSSTMALRLA